MTTNYPSLAKMHILRKIQLLLRRGKYEKLPSDKEIQTQQDLLDLLAGAGLL